MNRRSRGREVGDRVVDQCVGVAVDLELVDRVRPRPVEGGELVLAREQGGRRRRRRGRRRRPRRRRRRPGPGTVRPGSSSFHVTPWPPVVGVDPAAGEHAGVVGQRDRLLDLGAGVERRGTLAEQPAEGAVRPEPVQGTGVEPVDRDGQHVAAARSRGGLGGGGSPGLGAARTAAQRCGVGGGGGGAEDWSGAAVSLSSPWAALCGSSLSAAGRAAGRPRTRPP